MVTEYGMSDLGPIQYESNTGNVFLGRDYFKEKNFSDQVALEIDKEVRKIITECFDTAT
jgi:cell division protease FtsH